MVKLVAPYNVFGVSNTTIDEVIEWIKGGDNPVGYDIETTKHPEYDWWKSAGLDPYTSKIVMIQIGDVDTQFVIDTRFVSPIPVLKVLVESARQIVGTNLKFDYKHTLHNYGIRLTNLWDCMIAEMVMYCGLRTPDGWYSLVGMAERYSVPHQTDKSTRLEFLDIEYKPFTSTQVYYGAWDVKIPLFIKEEQVKKAIKLDITSCIRLENDFLKVLGEIELMGMNLDVDLWLQNNELYQSKLDPQLDLLNQWLLDNGYESFKGINWNSSKQVVELFKKIGIPTEVEDKENSTPDNVVYKDSVGKNHIIKFASMFDIIPILLEYKQLKRLVTAYGEKFLENLNPVTGRIHTDYYQILNTGRISSSSPNLQNIPNEEKREGFRNCFIAPPGRKMVVCDYSAQEGRILADYSQESNMINFFLHDGGDIHSFVATNMFKCEVSKTINPDLRQKGKITNFTIAYGGSAHKIADEFQIPIDEAQELIDMYFEAFPQLYDYFRAQHKFVLRNGYILIDPLTGRRSTLPDFDVYTRAKRELDYKKSQGLPISKALQSTVYKYEGKFCRDAQNYPIQGSGGSMTKYAGILFTDIIQMSNLDARIVNMVHDEIVVECAEEDAETVAKLLQDCMERAGSKWIKSIPMPASPQISDYWTH